MKGPTVDRHPRGALVVVAAALGAIALVRVPGSTMAQSLPPTGPACRECVVVRVG